MTRRFLLGTAALCAALFGAMTPAAAQDRETPYWASLRANEIFMRVGPGQNYRIEWVYRRVHLPVKVLRVKEGWRFVEDVDGTQGWMSAPLLKADRTAIVIGTGLAVIRDGPGRGGKVQWKAEPGVVGTLGECDQGWCEFGAFGKDGRERNGWISADRIWGDGD